MSVWNILANIGAVLTLGFGIWVIVQPDVIAEASEISFESARGRAEFRVALGGFFAGMGLAALLLQSPDAFFVVGLAWAIAAVTRLLAIPLDQPTLNATYFGFLASEVVATFFLIMPWLLNK